MFKVLPHPWWSGFLVIMFIHIYAAWTTIATT